MAGNMEGQENRKAKPNDTFNTPKPPVMGVLTQTLVRSPMIKYIIPARIRHQVYNDVILIHGNYLEVKEIVTKGYLPDISVGLQDVAIKADFDSVIRAARVLGSTRELTASVQEPTGIDAIIKKEGSEQGNTLGQYQLGIPPQVLVLALESRKLVFLFAFHDEKGSVRFISSERALPPASTSLEQLGEFIAVDPKSRAMAVAAMAESFCIYSTKSREQLMEEVVSEGKLHGDRFLPIKNERHMVEEGTIVKMEFLHPPKGDDNHVILLLVTCKDRKTRLVCYDWDCSKTDLQHAPINVYRQRVPSSEQLPRLLIPLTMSTAFMLVCEKQITVYKDILNGVAEAYTQDLEHIEPPEEPGRSKGLPIWTQWARPMRGHERTLELQDDIYLCREDGVVRYLSIDDGLAQMIDSAHEAGKLKVNIDTAFASIDLGVHHTDLLVAGGNLCDGGLWIFAPRELPYRKATIPNWTPLIDFTTAQVSRNTTALPGQLIQRSHPPLGQKRIFACTGKGFDHGAITEMRYGIEAAKHGPTIDLGEIAKEGIRQIWALDFSSTAIYILISHPMETSLLLMTSEGVESIEAENDTGIDFDARTIAAGITPDGLIIQVTEDSIRALSPLKPHHRFVSYCHNETILAACIQRVQGIETIVLTAVRNDQGCYIHLGYLNKNGSKPDFQRLGEPVLLSSEPSSMSIQCISEEIFAFIGTVSGTIQIFRADIGSNFSPFFEHTFEGQFAICESIAMISTRADSEQRRKHFILCGLRNGSLQTFCLNDHEPLSNIRFTFYEDLTVGSTPVSVSTDKTRSSRAIIACEQSLYTLEYPSKYMRMAPARLEKIFITGDDLSTLQQCTSMTFAQADSNVSDAFASGAVFFLDRNQLYMTVVSPDPHLVPCRLRVDGNPSRVIYSDRLRKLIVVYSRIVVRTARQTDGRYFAHPEPQPVITFLDPDTEPIKRDPDDIDDRDRQSAGEFRPGERVYGIMEWFPTDGNKQYHMLVVNTSLDHGDRGKSGRLLLFSITANAENEAALVPKTYLDLDFPVYAVTSYGTSSLIYSCGKDLILHKLAMGPNGRRWQDPFKYLMASEVMHISVHEHNVYLTTDQNSVSILQVEDDTRLVFQFNDRVARHGLHHLLVPQHSLLLASTKDCIVAGLWQPPQTTIENSTTTVFEVILPGSISRFRYVDRPTWYRDNSTMLASTNPNFQQTHPNAIPSTGIPEAIIGGSTDGSLYQFDLLDEPSWRLLRFIYNMAIRSPIICPFRDQIHRRHIEPSKSRNKFVQVDNSMHVDGDILNRWLDRGGEGLLGHMLALDPRGESNHEGQFVDFETASARRARFDEIITEIVELAAGERDLGAVVQWVRLKLQRAL